VVVAEALVQPVELEHPSSTIGPDPDRIGRERSRRAAACGVIGP
jgi:hypothetical protein